MFRPLFLALLSLSTVATAADPVVLEVGKPAPDFVVTVRDESELKLSDFRGKSHLLVVFGRAHW